MKPREVKQFALNHTAEPDANPNSKTLSPEPSLS